MDHISQFIINKLKEHPYTAGCHIELMGSRKHPDLVDLWSDIDISIQLTGHTSQTPPIKDLIESIGELIALEVIDSDLKILYRSIVLMLGNVEIIDLEFTPPKQTSWDRNIAKLDNTWVDEFWFKLFLASKKFMRNDHLIGMHLLLDCMRIILVLKMEERDKALQTNIHRFGGKENVHRILSLENFGVEDIDSITRYMVDLAETFDDLASKKDVNYTPKAEYILQFLSKT